MWPGGEGVARVFKKDIFYPKREWQGGVKKLQKKIFVSLNFFLTRKKHKFLGDIEEVSTKAGK